MPVSDSNDSLYSVVSVQPHDIIQRVQAAAGQAVSSGNVEVLEYLLAADGLDINSPLACQVYRSHAQPKELFALSREYVDLDGQATMLYLQDDFQHLYVDMQKHALEQIAAMEIILQCLAEQKHSSDFADAQKFKEHEAYVVEGLLKDTQVWLEQRKAKFYAVFVKDIQSFVKARNALVVRGKRLTREELEQEGIVKIWLEGGEKLINQHVDDDLTVLAGIKTREGLESHLVEWKARCEADKSRNDREMDKGNQARSHISEEMNDKSSVPIAVLSQRESSFKTFVAQLQKNKRVKGCLPCRNKSTKAVPDLFATEKEDVRLGLLSARVPVETEINGMTLFQLAIQANQLGSAKLLVRLGADPFRGGSNNALTLACAAPNGDFLKLLLDEKVLEEDTETDPDMLAIKAALLNYTRIYSERLSMYSVWRSICGYSAHMQERREQLVKYWHYYQVAKDEMEPSIMLAIIKQDAEAASRGILKKSRLNDTLLAALNSVQECNRPAVADNVDATDKAFANWQKAQEREARQKDLAGMNAWHEKADADYAFALPKSSVVDDLTHAVDKLALWRSSIFTMRRSILSNLSNSKLVINSPRESDDGQGSVLSSPMGGNMIEEFDESTPVESPKLKREVSPVGAGSVLSSVSGWFQREIKEDIAAIMAGCRGLKYERSVGNLASIF